MISGRASHAASVAVLIALTLFAGGPSLSNGFLNYDDPGMIVDNPRLDDPGFDDVVGAFAERREHAYLPVYVLALMPEAAVAGKDPAAFHAASLVWHALCALAVYLGVATLFRDRALALLAAALFAVHPVAAESVAWASGRKDQASLLLLFASLAAGYRHLLRGGRASLVAAPALLACAMLAKGTVVVQPALLLLVVATLRAEGRLAPAARPRALLAACAAVAVALAAVHYGVARDEGAAAGDPATVGAAERGLRFLEALGRYAFNLVAPIRLSISYDLRATGFGLAHFAGILLLGGAAAATVVALRARPGAPPSRVAFAGAWCGLALLPFNGVFPQSSVAMADRYLIVALPAVGLLVAAAIRRLPAPAAVAAAALFVGGLSAAARPRYAEFRDAETVFRSAMERDPRDPLPPLKLAEALRKGPPPKPEAAAALFGASFQAARDPVRRARALVLRADALVEAGSFLDAVYEHERIADLLREHGPALAASGLDVATVRYNAVVAQLGAGRSDAAAAALAALLGDFPGHSAARLLSAQLELRRAFAAVVGAESRETVDRARERANAALGALRAVGDAEDARRIDRSKSPAERADAARLAAAARAELARTLPRATWRSNFLNDALAEAERLVRDFPERAESYLVRAEVLREADPAQADADVAAAAEAEPRNPVALRAFADLLLRAGRNQDALRALLAASDAAPEDRGLAAAVADVLTASGRAHLEGRGGPRDLAKARTAAREARARRKDHAPAWTLEGECAEAEQDLDGAAACFEAALRADPDYAPAALALAKTHQARGLAILMNVKRYADAAAPESRAAVRAEVAARALAEFRAAVKLAPGADELAFARGRIAAENRLESVDPALERARGALARDASAEALALAESAVALDDAYAAAWEVLGHAAVAAGKDDRAAEAWRRVCELDPDNLPANLGLARLLWRRGKYDEAKERAERFLKAAEAYPSSPFLDEQRTLARSLLDAHRALRG